MVGTVVSRAAQHENGGTGNTADSSSGGNTSRGGPTIFGKSLLERVHDVCLAATGLQAAGATKPWDLSEMGSSLPPASVGREEKSSDKKGIDIGRVPYGKVTPKPLPKDLSEYLSSQTHCRPHCL
ncbi:hypothetical protein CC2G_014872 [Coprinopsis cinerea AmutBmut pab1-1]|nr:hypothetical protein CC2G_014872 [Coprinopsis cinerea AmutBmut pab1-1]